MSAIDILMDFSNENNNLDHFRECLSATLIEKLSQDRSKVSRKRRSKSRKNSVEQSTASIVDEENENSNDPAELSDFIEYLAEEIYPSIPPELRTISYAVVQDNPQIAEKYNVPLDREIVSTIVERLPPGIPDSFCSYGLIEEPSDLERFLEPVLNNFVTAATAAPPEYTPAVTASRPDGCEICGRDQLQLTYHHLIPRQMHTKAVKRGWHKEWQLNKVCWLVSSPIALLYANSKPNTLLERFADHSPGYLSAEPVTLMFIELRLMRSWRRISMM